MVAFLHLKISGFKSTFFHNPFFEGLVRRGDVSVTRFPAVERISRSPRRKLFESREKKGKFERDPKSSFFFIMSDPVLEKKKSVISAGASTAPTSWEDYKSRLKIFGWQNGTSYKW